MNRATREVYGEILRRYVSFHEGEDMHSLRQWGLFNWGEVSALIKSGHIITNMTKENKTIWCWPSKEVIDDIIKPAYERYLNDTGRHDNTKFDFGSYDNYI